MQKLQETFVKDFYHRWKNLRESDFRLSREFGMSVNEVRSIKKHLSDNFYPNDLDETDVSTYVDESNEESESPGRLTRSIGSVVAGAAKLGKGVIDKMSGLVFEEPGGDSRRMEKKERVFTQERGFSTAPREKYEHPVAAHAEEKSPAFMKIEEELFRKENDDKSPVVFETPLERAILEQEVEKRFAEKVGPILNDSPEADKEEPSYEMDGKKEISVLNLLRYSKPKQDKDKDKQLVFTTALDQVMFKQACSKLLHERKEMRAIGIQEVERIARKNRSAIRAIVPLVQDINPDVRAQALISLINLGSNENMDLFTSSLSDENVRVRLAAIRGIFKFTGKDAGRFLSYAMNDESVEVRETIARHVVTNRDTVAVSELIDQLGKERDPVVRMALLQTLTLVCEKSTIACLISMLNDSYTAVRRLAFHTLQEWTGKDFGYVPDAPRLVRERAILEFMHWWTEVKDAFQFRIQEPKRKEPPAGRMARPLAEPQEKRRDNNAVSSVTPAHEEKKIKESVPLHTGHGVQTQTGKRITMPARKTMAAPAQKIKAPPGPKTKGVRIDLNALGII